MKKKFFLPAGLIALFALLLTVQIVFAHTAVTAGNYTIEVGWVNEPAIVGQQNAVVVNVSTTSDHKPVGDVSGLIVAISYGDQGKTLTL